MERITATILTAVERQLTKYFTAMSHQAEAARMAADQRTSELRAEMAIAAAQLPVITSALEVQTATNEHYQQALQAALEERLAEFANHQHWRMNDLEEKLTALPTGGATVDPETILEIRQTVRDDMERSFAAIHSRLDDVNNLNKRQDEQANAIVQHVNDTTSALTTRMDEGNQRLGHAIDERIDGVQSDLATTLEGISDQVNEHASTLLMKLESSETRATDRLLELEARVKEEQGQKIANVEAAVGRVGAGFDDAMIAVSQRVLELENKLLDLDDRLLEMNERLGQVDQAALDEVRAEMSRAVGEAMLVRIELDRVVSSVDEKVDKQTIRMSEIEGLLSDQMDVSTAVQLERIDELERQVEMLDPSQFVRVAGGAVVPVALVDPGAIPTLDSYANSSSNSSSNESGHDSGTNTGSVPTADGGRADAPTMSLNPRLPGADTSGQETLDSEGSFTSH